jgi:hypothetical protein
VDFVGLLEVLLFVVVVDVDVVVVVVIVELLLLLLPWIGCRVVRWAFVLSCGVLLFVAMRLLCYSESLLDKARSCAYKMPQLQVQKPCAVFM